MSREAMQMALEALELLARYENPSTKIQVRKPKDGGSIVTMYPHKVATEAAALLRERLSKPEQEPVCAHGVEKTKCDFCQSRQEPVAWASSLDFDDDDQEIIPAKDKGKLGTSNCDIPLYTVPKREWVGLTDEEIAQGLKESWVTEQAWQSAVWWAEAKLKEKNHG